MAPDPTLDRDLSLPALRAMTGYFTSGEPRAFSISPDGARAVFLRSPGPFSAALGLWSVELGNEDSEERLVVDPVALLEGGSEDVPEAERQRRERMREMGGGITSYDCDRDVAVAAFVLSGVLYVANLLGAPAVRRLGEDVGVVDPRIDPTGRRVAYVVGDSLRVADLDGTGTRTVATSRGSLEQVGLADFIAAEEFGRARGHWWSPDGAALCFEVVDETDVEEIWLFDPIAPGEPARPRRYPRAGTANAAVSLRIAALDAQTVDVIWDKDRFPYLATVSWPGDQGTGADGPLATVMSRDQRDHAIVAIDPDDGSTRVLCELHDDSFLEPTPGLPALTADGQAMVGAVDTTCDTYRVGIVQDGRIRAFTPPGLQVASVVGHNEHGVLVVATSAPTGLEAVEVGFDGAATRLGDGSAHVRALAGSPRGAAALACAGIDRTEVSYWIEAPGVRRRVPSMALGPESASPPVQPAPSMLEVGAHRLQVAVLLPSDPAAARGPLPVIMAPYGGPHFQRVVSVARAYSMEQYMADQGFCVIVADGRGTGGRGPAWDRSVHLDLADKPVEDQIAALQGVAAKLGDVVDTSRVGVFGWSFGGYLAARCVLVRPDVFHAALAGAPVTDFGWYDTGYTERYLGHPDEHPDVYERHSLVPLAAGLRRELFLLHGYVDDNVLFCHTQMLSNALAAAGRPHRVVGLSGTTHMPRDPVVVEHMAQVEIDFFRDAFRTL